MTRIAVIGISEFSLAFAVRLQEAGADVVCFDSIAAQFSPVTQADSVEEAVLNADLVFVFSSAHQALTLARTMTALLKPGALYVDFSPVSPAIRNTIAAAIGEEHSADGAIAQEKEIELSGPAAKQIADVLMSLSEEVTVVSDKIGDVATRTILRSLLKKSLATAITDTLWAAESLGVHDWVWEEIHRLVQADIAQELIDDTARNFKRHQIEMQDVAEIVASSGYDSTMIAPTQFNHGRIMHGKKIPHSQPSPKK